MSKSILVVDDEEAVAWALRKACERQGHVVEVAASAEEALRKVPHCQPAVIFLDVRLPGMTGLDALAKIPELAPDAAVVIMTAHGNLNTAVKAVQGGAFDYLAKPFDLPQAMETLDRALQRNLTAHAPAKSEPRPREELLGNSRIMQSVFLRIALVSPTNACVLITGESGTGKELVARAIHANSPRQDRPFLPVHIAALNPNLIESELFGHVRGAFTGADRNRSGLLALANGGTVFLDELGDIPLAVQAKLLRVLERQELQPVGSAETQQVDVRIVSATNADLAGAVQAGTFRQDLFFRLNVYPIHLPALRERLEDLPLLANSFYEHFHPTNDAEISDTVLSELRQRSWPGNVRELRNAIEHACINARGEPIQLVHLPSRFADINPRTPKQQLQAAVLSWVQQSIESSTSDPKDLYQALLDQVEPPLLEAVLRQTQGNRQISARWLGLARATLRKFMRKYHLGEDEKIDGEENDDAIAGY